MTREEEEQVRSFIARDGSRWAPMPVWQHRILAWIVAKDLMRGMPDGASVFDCPAYKRAVARRQRRLAREASRG